MKPERPSLPHAITRVPTGPQRATEDGVAERRTTNEPHPPTFSAEEWGQMLDGKIRAAVISTRNDELLQRDNKRGLDQSTTIMKLERESKRLKIYIGVLLGMSTTIGGAAANCANAYQDVRMEAIEPVARAEAKAERAEAKVGAVAETVDDKLAAFETRHQENEKVLAELAAVVRSTSLAVAALDHKLDTLVVPPANVKRGSK